MSNLLEVDLTNKDISRLFNKIVIDKKNGCWNWTGTKDPGGYGGIMLKGKRESIHRVVYAWLIQSIPRNKGKNIPQLDHLCKNRACCNPLHLELVSFKENILRGVSPSALHARKIYCKNGHRLPNKYTLVNKNGKRERICLTCRRKYEREYMRKYRLSHRN